MSDAKKGELAANGKLKRNEYERELARLHVEFVKLQQWVVHEGLKVCILFEGRDGAGKGGTIKAMTERVSPRIFRVMAVATENRIRAGGDAAMGYPRFGMIDLLKLLGGLLVGVFRSHAAREAEMAFLRQQLVVLKRSAPARLRRAYRISHLARRSPSALRSDGIIGRHR